MKMRLFVLLSALFCFSALPSLAASVGEACSSLGMSAVTPDKQGLMTCLQNAEGKLVWKSPFAASGKGALCGLAIASFGGTLNATAWAYNLNPLHPCQGQDIIAPIYGSKSSPTTPTGVQSNCPAGYELKGFVYEKTSPASGANVMTGSSLYVCAAN